MDETQLRLDGNAAAGVLRNLFVDELTTARGACAGLRCNRTDRHSAFVHADALARRRPALQHL